MMTRVAATSPPQGWTDAAALTLSCSKLDGNWFGASPNLNCGLCVSCLVRRATFLKAAMPDKTTYVFEAAGEQQLQALINARRGDIEAVKYAIDAGVDPGAMTPEPGPPATTSTRPRRSYSAASTNWPSWRSHEHRRTCSRPSTATLTSPPTSPLTSCPRSDRHTCSP